MLEICIGITILIKYQVCEFVVVFIIKAVNPYMYMYEAKLRFKPKLFGTLARVSKVCVTSVINCASLLTLHIVLLY